MVRRGDEDKRLHVFVQRAGRVSRALWPANIRSGVATGKAAQRRRSLILKYRWLAWLLDVLHGQHPITMHPAPNTPVPEQNPLVRVWETIDLSQIDADTGGDTAELLLGWSEEQAAAYWAQTAANPVPISSIPVSSRDTNLSGP